MAFGDGGPEKTVKISAFFKVTTTCQQGIYKRTLKLVFTKTLKTVKFSAFRKVTTCGQQGDCKRRLKLVFTKTPKSGKHPPSPQRLWRDKSAVAAAMADREGRNVFEEFDRGFRGWDRMENLNSYPVLSGLIRGQNHTAVLSSLGLKVRFTQTCAMRQNAPRNSGHGFLVCSSPQGPQGGFQLRCQ
jgi:hypothetical protein